MSKRHLKDFVASLFIAAVIAAAALLLEMSAAQAQLVPAQLVPTQDAASLVGAKRAQGAVIWSHGRSLEQEASLDPTPEYIGAFRAAGWDTFRPNRPSITDTLTESAAALAVEAEAWKHRGYRRVVLAGQSFGAFISLIAAGHSDAVDTVIGTAPAASWQRPERSYRLHPHPALRPAWCGAARACRALLLLLLIRQEIPSQS
jgi:alpha-beta hydrolase superfamily lysophospholipase